MDFLLTNGTAYAMMITLVGSATWMTDDVVAQKLIDMGFINVEVTTSESDSNNRYVSAVWNGSTGADPNYFPAEISDLHEI